MAKTFTCSLVTPEAAVFETEATYADLPAHDGQMGVMADRAPMLVKLGVGRLILEPISGAKQEFVLDGGFAQMNENRLTLLCERAWPADQITAERARQIMADAQALPKNTTEEVAQRDHDITVARHMLAAASA